MYKYVALVVKNLPANAGGIRNVGSVSRSKRSPGGGHGKPLQYSYLETQVRSLGQEDPLEEGMATQNSILAGEFHGQRSLMGYIP